MAVSHQSPKQEQGHGPGASQGRKSGGPGDNACLLVDLLFCTHCSSQSALNPLNLKGRGKKAIGLSFRLISVVWGLKRHQIGVVVPLRRWPAYSSDSSCNPSAWLLGLQHVYTVRNDYFFGGKASLVSSALMTSLCHV